MHWIDPNCLKEASGVIDCFLQNADGEPDGLLLPDGTEVHFPPHMVNPVIAALKPGDPVRIRGLRPRTVSIIPAVTFTPEGGATILDKRPQADDERRRAERKQAHAGRSAMEAEGMLRQTLHGPRGEIRGLLVENGSAGRFPPDAAAASAPLLARNARLLMRGEGRFNSLGAVIAVQEIGTSPVDLQPIGAKFQKGEPDKPHKRPPGHQRHHTPRAARDPLTDRPQPPLEGTT